MRYEIDVLFYNAPRRTYNTRNLRRARRLFLQAINHADLYYVTLIEIDQCEFVLSTTRHVPIKNRRKNDD